MNLYPKAKPPSKLGRKEQGKHKWVTLTETKGVKKRSLLDFPTNVSAFIKRSCTSQLNVHSRAKGVKKRGSGKAKKAKLAAELTAKNPLDQPPPHGHKGLTIRMASCRMRGTVWFVPWAEGGTEEQ